MKTIQEVVESSRLGDDRPGAREDRDARGLPDAARRPAHPLARRAAGAGSAADGLQVVRRAGLCARQPAQPQRDRRPERPLRHHRQRQGLQRHAPGAGRPGAGRRHLPALGIRLHKVNVVWPLEATITRDFATGLQEILVVEEKRQVIEYQLKEELYNWRPDVRPNVLGKFDEPEGEAAGGEWSMPNPSQTLAAARQGRPDAGHDRQGHRPAPEEAGRGPGRSDIAARMDRGWPSSRRASASMQALKSTHRRPPALVLQRLPAQHQHPRARGLARHGRHRLPLHGGLDGPQHQHLHADGRRGRALGRPGALQQRPAHVRQPGRRHLLPQRAAGHPPEHRRGRQHHLQDPLQRRRGHDRRPAGGRAARGPLGAADRAEPAGRRRAARWSSSPTSPRSTTGAAAAGVTVHHRDELDRSSASCARSRAPRSSSTTRPAPPRSAAAASAASWPTRPSAWSSTSWCAKAAATAACRATA
jgi:hypothetical protein